MTQVINIRQGKRGIESFRDGKCPETWLFSLILMGLRLDIGLPEMLDHHWVMYEEKTQSGAGRYFGWQPDTLSKIPFGNNLKEDLKRSRSEVICIKILQAKSTGGESTVDTDLIYYCVNFLVSLSFFEASPGC